MSEAARRNIWEILGNAATAGSDSQTAGATRDHDEAIDNEELTTSS